jgi:putative Mg2+ transporter-C (MgtC) family protein
LLSIFDGIRDVSILSICIRLLLAAVTGGLLGMEREKKNRPAGFRTYMLVSVGACIVMITNQFVFQYFGSTVTDPTRMGAQVINGIGFLGAGTIVMTGKNKIKGITTAAGLWTVACSGLAIGIGFYEVVILGTICLFLIMTGMQRLDKRIRLRAKYIDLYIEYKGTGDFSQFIEYARDHQISVADLQMQRNKLGDDKTLTILLTATSAFKLSHQEVISRLGEAPGVEFIEEI